MTSRRAEDLPRQIAQLQRQIEELNRLATRQGHGHGLGYAEVTSGQTGIGTSDTDLTGLSVTVNVAANRRIRITGRGQISGNNPPQLATGNIKESTNSLGRWVRESINSVHTGYASVVITPTAGPHTYKLSLSVASGTVDLQAAATVPAFILVEDIGPA